jgi:hypothetical protein
MLPIIPSYSSPSTTNIASGLVNASADVRNLVESSSGVNDRLAQLSNNVQRELTVANNGIALDPNQDVNIFANATGGAFGVTLPALSTQYKPILFKKHKDVTYNGFTVTCAGTDKIQDITAPLATFTATSFTIKSPDQSFILTPTSAGWEITAITPPAVRFHASLSTAGVNATNTTSKLYYNNELYDVGGYYNNATSGTGGRYTPLVAGIYDFFASAYFNSGSSAELIILIQRNGVDVHQTSFTDTGNAVISAFGPGLVMNGTTDYVEVFVRAASATRGILNLASVTHFKGKFISYN